MPVSYSKLLCKMKKTDTIDSDKKYMQLALQLAKTGIGKVSPNPMVGCVIVKNGKIVSTGYHKRTVPDLKFSNYCKQKVSKIAYFLHRLISRYPEQVRDPSACWNPLLVGKRHACFLQ